MSNEDQRATDPEPRAGEVTLILQRVNAGEDGALEFLLERCYEELRAVSRSVKRSHGATNDLETTVVANEVFLKLHRKAPSKPWENSVHYFGSARVAATQVVLDQLRRQSTRRRAADDLHARESARELRPTTVGTRDEMRRLLAAFDQLGRDYPRAAQVAIRKLLHNQTDEEVAEQLGVSRRTVQNDWRFARAVLKDALDSER